MTESIWHKEECGPGRSYMLGKDPYIKYEDRETIISTIVNGLREVIHSEPAVRLSLDSPKSDAERAILAIPFETDQEVILLNLAKVLYQSFMGYYFSAVPKTSHFGITNMLFEGNVNSALRREVESFIAQLQTRPDMAGRILRDVTLVGKNPVPKSGDVFLSDTVKQGLDIHVGYRIYVTGESVNCVQIFLPVQTGAEIIDQIYFNIERMLHHNFITYDENGEGYLKVTDTLIFKELTELLKRSRTKEFTRNKILNNLQFDTVSKRDDEEEKKLLIGDRLYDVLNHIQDTKLQEATDRSRDLYTAMMRNSSQFAQPQFESVRARGAISQTPVPVPDGGDQSGGQGPAPHPSADSGAPPARSFKRRAPAGAGGSTRRKFQKVDLTQDELEVANVQVPEPPDKGSRVPSPRRGRRITRIRPEEVGAGSKKD